MKLSIVTIALDAIQFLPTQFATFNRLNIDWTWYIAEGVAANVKDTSWCKPMHPRLSLDGTTQFLNGLKGHPRIKVFQKPIWVGKVDMFNTMLAEIKEPCVLLQVDADEIWTAEQIEKIVAVFTLNKGIDSTAFFCRYFVGPNLKTLGENCYGANHGEWLRAWRFDEGRFFIKHEPPILSHSEEGESLQRETTRSMGLVFDHYAYAYQNQVAFKQQFYGYKNAVQQWQRLQKYQGPFPTLLKPFLDWVDDRVMVDRLHK